MKPMWIMKVVCIGFFQNDMKKYKNLTVILPVILGLFLILYPLISNHLYDNRADSIVQVYEQEVADDGVNSAMIADAVRYNSVLATGIYEPIEEYEKLLCIDSTGLMGFVDIPKIGVFLPIYHGTGEALEKGVGHLFNSSLPVGGESTHAVLSAHTGAYQRFFTDLTEMEKGDHFFLQIAGQTLAYEVDQIVVVTPEQVSEFQIEAGRDLVTLLTCTPYGVNSHRLLVRGTRIEYTPEVTEQVTTQESTNGGSLWMREYLKSLIIGMIALVVITIVIALNKRRKEWSKGY